VSGHVTDCKLVISIVGLELLWLFGGGLCLYIGIKKGFIERRMERRGQVFTGPEAVLAGVFHLFLGALSWSAASSRRRRSLALWPAATGLALDRRPS